MCTAESLRHHQQSFLPQISLVLSATGSLELRLVSSAILEHTNNNTSHSSLGLVIVSNDRRTNERTYNLLILYVYCKSDICYNKMIKFLKIGADAIMLAYLFIYLFIYLFTSMVIIWESSHEQTIGEQFAKSFEIQ